MFFNLEWIVFRRAVSRLVAAKYSDRDLKVSFKRYENHSDDLSTELATLVVVEVSGRLVVDVLGGLVVVGISAAIKRGVGESERREVVWSGF